MELEHLQDLFVDGLKDVYSAENQLVKSLPKMAKAATDPQLRAAFQKHLAETQGQIERLDALFKALETSPRGKKCHAMEGLVEEGKEIIEEDAEEEVRDAGLIAAAQKVEHYEIASYGTLKTWAELIGNKLAAKLLKQTLDEEHATDKLLTGLAESINVKANG